MARIDNNNINPPNVAFIRKKPPVLYRPRHTSPNITYPNPTDALNIATE